MCVCSTQSTFQFGWGNKFYRNCWDDHCVCASTFSVENSFEEAKRTCDVHSNECVQFRSDFKRLIKMRVPLRSWSTSSMCCLSSLQCDGKRRIMTFATRTNKWEGNQKKSPTKHDERRSMREHGRRVLMQWPVVEGWWMWQKREDTFYTLSFAHDDKVEKFISTVFRAAAAVVRVFSPLLLLLSVRTGCCHASPEAIGRNSIRMFRLDLEMLNVAGRRRPSFSWNDKNLMNFLSATHFSFSIQFHSLFRRFWVGRGVCSGSMCVFVNE